MDELLKLLGLVDESKKAEAQALVDAVSNKIKEQDLRITQEEKAKLDEIAKNKDIIMSRDAMKQKLKEVAMKLGASEVDNINDAIETIKSKKGVDKIEALEVREKEIEQLKQEVAQYKEAVEQSKSEAQRTVTELILERDLAMVLPKHKAVDELVPYLIQDIKQTAQVDEKGNLVFKNQDGTTVRINGRDATLEDMILQKKEKEMERQKQESGYRGTFFNLEVQDSGAGNTGGTRVEDDDFLLRD